MAFKNFFLMGSFCLLSSLQGAAYQENCLRFTVNKKYEIISTSEFGTIDFNISPHESIGKSIFEIIPLGEQAKNNIKTICDRVIQTRQGKTISYNQLDNPQVFLATIKACKRSINGQEEDCLSIKIEKQIIHFD